jgi:phosphate transport system substrate-binding protein
MVMFSINRFFQPRGSLMPKTVRLAALLLAGVLLAPTAIFADVATINVAGSTALLPLVKAAAETYQTKYPDVKISVTGGGSRVGITQVVAKAIDLGDSDILAKGYPELVDHRIAVIGFAVVTNPEVGIRSLSKKQIQGIFSGEIDNWKDVGGKDEAIVVINRPRSSGTRAVFTQTLMGNEKVSESGLVEDATGTVVSALKTTPGAISYAAFSGVRNQGLTEVRVDGVAPTDANVITGKYAFWSYEHIFTNGQPNADVARFLAFLEHERELALKLGYIPVRDMKVAENNR